MLKKLEYLSDEIKKMLSVFQNTESEEYRIVDTEQKRIQAICEVAHINDIGDLSDGYHTFNQLYYQRMMLFAVLVKQNRDKAWKSLRHEDGELCFGGGWFIVGIDTPEGSYTYHYENKYFDLFDCEILDHGKHWDGHTEKDVTRLLSLEQEPILDKIRAEIMQLDYNLESVDYDQNDMAMTEEVHMICREELLQIIDRYRVESEE